MQRIRQLVRFDGGERRGQALTQKVAAIDTNHPIGVGAADKMICLFAGLEG